MLLAGGFHFSLPSIILLSVSTMFHKRTYLRLLGDVYIAPKSGGRGAGLVTINRGKLDKLIDYLKFCPRKLSKVCMTLYRSVTTNCQTKKKRWVVVSGMLILQVSGVLLFWCHGFYNLDAHSLLCPMPRTNCMNAGAVRTE